MVKFYPLVSSLVAFIFAALVLRQYLQRRGMHQLIWSIALFVFSFAAFCEFYSEMWGWPVLLYRFYYVSAAALVAYLGLGSIYLIWKRKVGNIALVCFLILTATMLVMALTAPINTAVLQERGVTVAGKAMPGYVRLMSPLHTIPGTLALFGGALYSVYLFWRHRDRLAYRISANLFIAAGAIVIAGAGSMARGGLTAWLYPAETVGIILMFVGFLQAGSIRRPAPQPAPALKG